MRPRTIDLNLLVMLEALVAERSVSKAARRMGLTQSAMSHALRRLRDTFNDELFVRSPDGMEPTLRALELANATHAALEQIERTIDKSASFDPATAERTFTLRISEYVSGHLLQRLCPILRKEAPGIRINAAHFTGDPREDEIVGDEIHVRLASSGNPEGRRERLRVLDERFVVLMRKTNAARRSKMTLPFYASLSHVKVAGTIGTNVIDDALRIRGLYRQIVFNVPSWRDARHIVANSDLVAAIPARWARDRETPLPCVAVRFPLDDVTFAIDLEWHPRFALDPGQTWFRALIAKQF
ncbi:LysR family transcriptional regulator [Bradyrhizobium neotropicale]|uniref:LysR family transcriptional regulator n=1 Tax=Bradyrhizobium neotropicale TaxID=1497615 RepID=UPI001AD71AA4|nr:LysR family transcriptional regulator [Bradyrhizobium neotropicale]MBO4225615.1 LysR family transcriptional regulator [Bradyrhizobium neotropicale]